MTSTQNHSTVRAGISERSLFASLSNWFASSFSVLGELMQNARRASATGVHFTLDGKDLIIQDDGVGIDNFQTLVQFAESGWKVETQIAENPFGMGFFSTLYCAEAVTIQSKGKCLKVSLADVLARRELNVTNDPWPVSVGTRITMHRLEDKFLETSVKWVDGSRLHQPNVQKEIAVRALGFPIDVSFNADVLPRPHAKAVLPGELTDVGYWHVKGVHDDAGVLCDSVAYYLQGLPICKRPYDFSLQPAEATSVLHLDSSSFVAMLPDRAHVKDEEQAMVRVKRSFFDLMRRHLVAQKSQLSSEEFVKRWFDYAHKHAHAELFNDVPLLPMNAMGTVNSVNYSGAQCYESCLFASQDLYITAEEVASGQVKVWKNAPSSSTEDPLAAALLKVMQRQNIMSLRRNLHPDHWIYKMSVDCCDLVVHVTPGAIMGREQMPDTGDVDSCELVLVTNFTVRVTACTDPAFELVMEVDDDWIVVPAGVLGQDWELDAGDMASDNVCYLTVNDRSNDHPVHVFSDFTDDNDHCDETWESQAIDRFNGLVRGLRGMPLAKGIDEALQSHMPSVTDQQVACLSLIRTVRRWNPRSASGGHLDLNVCDLNTSVWEEVSNRIGVPGLTAQALQAAFTAVIRPGELLGVECESSEMLKAAGYTPLHTAPDVWLALLPGESKPDFEAENHNYIGHFSSRADMLNELLPTVLERAARHHGIDLEVLQAKPFVERYSMVREAHPLNIVSTN